MGAPFNNEQWRRAHGSLASSEWTGTDNTGQPYYPEAHSSADVTSLSSDLLQQDSGWINTEPRRQAPEPSQPFDDDLAYMTYIDPAPDLTNEYILQHIDDHLGGSIIRPRAADKLGNESTALQPSRAAQTLPGGIDRTKMGIPSSTPFALQPSLDGVMDQVVETYRALVYSQSWSPDQVSQGLQSLETIKNFFHTKLPSPTIPSAESSEPDKPDRELYLCWICDPAKERNTFPAFATFKRHLTGHGILEYGWRCTKGNCNITLRRRDRMHDHLLHLHNRSGVPPEVVEATRVRYVPPTNCPCPPCHEKTPSWRVYFNHIKEHYLISPGSGTVSTNGDRSRRDDNAGGNGGNGNGHGPGHDFSLAGPSNSSGQPSSQSNNWTGSTPYSSVSFGGVRSRSNARPGPISQSVSDSQLNSSYHQRANNAIGEHLMDEMPPPSFEPRAPLPKKAGGQPKTQPPQNPGLSRSNNSTKRKRSDKQKEPAEEKAPDPNKCRRCKHPMAGCQLCKSVRGCHECGGMTRSAIQVGDSSIIPVQALPDASSTIVNLNESYPNPLVNYAMPQHMPTQLSIYHDHNEMMQFLDLGSYGTMVPESHPILSDLGGKVQELPVLESDTKLLRSIGLGTSDDPLSIKGQAKEMKEKFTSPTPGLNTDLGFRGKRSSAILEGHQPVSTCQCLCVTIPTVNYEAHASLQLSPNERVEMTFQMSPERETNHPLRTRVQVFVKLFTLRASAAQSKAKQRARSITSETTFDEAESDADSEQELSLTSLSGSEITPLFYWDVQDWSFDFHIKWAILKLAQWTSGIDAGACYKLLLSDPGQILDLISIYILCKFKVSWLLMGRNGVNLFLSL
ncbi:hypothetical protein N7491_010609 [Penicillium cf. griseofulvum]|nr:hypothetical protein N7491_010609 [Penicillium cf. griseofulvum]